MNQQLNSFILKLQAYKEVQLDYLDALYLVPASYDADDETQINNYWYKVGDAQEAWDRLDSFRASIQADITDDLRIKMKLSDTHLLLKNFENAALFHSSPPRFG